MHKRKALGKEKYNRIIDILLDLNVHVLIYIFVKPLIPYITDDEAIDELLRKNNKKDSFDKGAYAVGDWRCGYIVENSDMYNLYKDGRYKPLSFWEHSKIIKECYSIK